MQKVAANWVSQFLTVCMDSWNHEQHTDTVKPVCNDHLYNKIYYLCLIQ